jgi:hypothetical protein
VSTSANPAEAPPRLKRVLTLWDLILYGVVLIMPIAPVPLFGVAQKLSDGHAVTTILLSMFAMLLTAFSYGRMAAVFDFGMDRGKIFKILPVDFRHIDYKESSFADPGRDDPIFIAPDHEAHVVFDGERVFAFGLDADGRLSDDALND